MSKHTCHSARITSAKIKTTTDAEELESWLHLKISKWKDNESTLKELSESMIQQLNCHLNMMEIELSEFLRGSVAKLSS